MTYISSPKLSKPPGFNTENAILQVGQPVINQDFKHVVFKFLGGSAIIFKNCDFSFSRFTDVYFRDCSFENCIFTGSKFSDSNLRDCTFANCQFNYVEFKNTEIPWEEIKLNLPSLPNVRERLLRSLRKNQESLGDRRSIKPILTEEIKALNEYYEKALDFSNPYYSNKYNTPQKRFQLTLDKRLNDLSWYLWGHGEFTSHIFFSTCGFLVLITLITIVTHLPTYLSPVQPYCGPNVLSIFMQVLNVFLGVSTEQISYIPHPLKLIILLTRYVVLSLYVSTLARRHSWR